MTIFRPCIDLHAGSVKQIVGGTLSTDPAGLKTNFTSEHPAAYYAELYRKHDLRGGHVIMLGPDNDEAAVEALRAWPGGLQVGGGIKDGNAAAWVERGAEKVGVIFLLVWRDPLYTMLRRSCCFAPRVLVAHEIPSLVIARGKCYVIILTWRKQ